MKPPSCPHLVRNVLPVLISAIDELSEEGARSTVQRYADATKKKEGKKKVALEGGTGLVFRETLGTKCALFTYEISFTPLTGQG